MAETLRLIRARVRGGLLGEDKRVLQEAVYKTAVENFLAAVQENSELDKNKLNEPQVLFRKQNADFAEQFEIRSTRQVEAVLTEGEIKIAAGGKKKEGNGKVSHHGTVITMKDREITSIVQGLKTISYDPKNFPQNWSDLDLPWIGMMYLDPVIQLPAQTAILKEVTAWLKEPSDS